MRSHWQLQRMVSRADRLGLRRRETTGVTSVQGYDCTGAVQTMFDLAGVLTDVAWERALESALRKNLVAIEELEALGRSVVTQAN